MKKGWVATFTLVALTVAIFAGRQYLRLGDPEISNTADSLDGGSQGDMPAFFVSDPSLLNANAHRIEEVIRADDKSTLSNAPYFLLLEDGRFAFGYSDDDGKTRPLFVAHDLPYQLYLYDEAWAQWEIRRPDGAFSSADASAR